MFPMHTLPIPDVDVTTYTLRHAAALTAKPALIDGVSGEVLTYGALAEGVHRLAGGLAARGIGPGDALALMAPTCPAFATVFHGTAFAGAAITPLNPSYTVEEARHQLRDSGARIAVAAASCAATLVEAAAGTCVERIVCLEEGAHGLPGLASLYGAPMASPPARDPRRTVAALPYSSGTTGLSKGVMLSHRNLVANMVQLEERLAIERGETLVATLPFFHIYGMNTLMNPALAAGATVVTMPRFELQRFLELHAEHRARRCFVVPPIAIALAKDPRVERYDLSALRFLISGAAPLSAELTQACASRLCCGVTQGFGMTELSPVSHFAPLGAERVGSVGTPLPNTEVRVVDLTGGGDAAPGQEGEVWIRGPQVMLGYHGNPAATAATVTPDGWLRTGDVGRVDEDGYLFIVDRLKELIKFKGFQVAPAELEAVLLGHPDVADAAVVGRPDDEGNRYLAGFVVLKAGCAAQPEALRWHMAQRLAPYKRPDEIRFVGEIPKSPSGKILRRVLRQSLVPA
jgi:acyl-CoA synthetase (AMP-forming)/AMP-acid ligase II